MSAKVSGKWKHLFICPDRQLFQTLTPLLAEVTPTSPFNDLKAYPNRRALAEVLATERPNLCFLDVGSNRDSALMVLGDLASLKSTLPVVAIHSGNDPDLILRCLRAGAREFLFQPFSMEQIAAALERMARLVQETNIHGRDAGRVFCVMPGKGSAGATTIACSLAYHLHRLDPDKKTLLADFDPTTGTLSFVLKLKSQFSFAEALAHVPHIDDDIWKGLVIPSQNIDIVLSPETPIDGLAETHDPGPIIDYSREVYGSVVLDSRNPYGAWGQGLARACDELLLVTTNELPVLHATQKTLAHLDRCGVDRSKVRLIVNRYNPEAGLGKEAIETAMRLDVFAVLPNDYDTVQKALMEGKPVSSTSGLGKAVGQMASQLAGKSAKAQTKSLLGGLFSAFTHKL